MDYIVHVYYVTTPILVVVAMDRKAGYIETVYQDKNNANNL